MTARSRWVVFAIAGMVMFGFVASTDSDAQAPPRKTFVMPRIAPNEFVVKGAAMAKTWELEAMDKARDRTALYESVVDLFARYSAFTDEVAEIYPKEGLEWLLITDEVCDSITTALMGPLEAYQKSHPEEVLTQGRQLFELELMKITGPPARVLGFHVVRLGSFSAEKVAELHVPETTTDLDGLADGFLRHLSDWCFEYWQVHDTELNTYRSRLNQQDWVIVRLRDECGNTGKWKIKNQYMALIGVDSTKTPPQDVYAHEFELVGTSCDETRTIRIDLPNYLAMQREVLGGGNVSPFELDPGR
ncbi:MAG: hypothetical protein KDA27_18465 [Candidatus Eisenbacteria bacterium]|uniref:Uncharacterized protein n=1 Tax=Eiseniibacteriota bacterium TaxID=2212470 RepID=A0A956NES9_UNCEI|nr:hypothetical protein [Candidatus Eisenbacteria bacterium]MCB9462408.1 hypothetical protein [Candidatus Eisenbacteria bacterium]